MILTLLLGCSGNVPEPKPEEDSHVHSYSMAWTYDSNNHWHAATCEHKDEKSANGPHTFPSEWTVRTPATENEAGLEFRTCSVCGYEQTREIPALGHTHTFSDEWEYDETHHWRAATCGHADEKADYEEHNMVNGACSVCGLIDLESMFYLSEVVLTVRSECRNNIPANVVIPEKIGDETVVSLGDNAFYLCYNLKTVTIPDSVTSLGSKAFANCTALTTVNLPSSVTSIGDNAFLKCSSLTEITLPDSLENLGEAAFMQCSALTSISIPETVTEIKASTFNLCSLLATVTLHDGITSIGNNAFCECNSLDLDKLPSSLTSIGAGAFRSTKTSSVVVPDGLTTISDTAFYGCYNLSSLDLNNVTSIGKNAFQGCTKLTSLNIPAFLSSIEYNSFAGNKIEQITVSGNTKFKVENGCLLNYAGTQLLMVPGGRTDELVIPSSVTSIREYAFSGCTKNLSVTIPSSVTTLATYTFSGAACSVTIPSSVTIFTVKKDGGSYVASPFTGFSGTVVLSGDRTTIPAAAFYDSDVKSVTMPDTVTEIGSNAFSKCSSLKEINLSTALTTISQYAFYQCSALNNVTIPISIVQIGTKAFYRCTSLTYLRFSGTKYKWQIKFTGSNKSNLGANWYEGPSNQVLYIRCSDGNLDV